MVNFSHHEKTGDVLDDPAAALFQQQWQLYRVRRQQLFLPSRGLWPAAPNLS
jgi:hypothetical protein